MVAISLCTRKGSWKSNTEIGNDLLNIQYLGTPELASLVPRFVAESEPIATLVAADNITIVFVDYEVLPSGALLVSVDYTNNALDRNKVVRATNGAT
jgi:hypothetical protein